MKLISDPKVKEVLKNYPEHIKAKILRLRELILSVASEMNEIETLEETLKWGEPSYLTKYGSTIRFDWKKKSPDQYAIYFKCTSKLVPTFKTLFKDKFKFEGNRAIVFELNEKLPEEDLKQCISMALKYHKVKHLPLLGF